jgi:hypothetical protein
LRHFFQIPENADTPTGGAEALSVAPFLPAHSASYSIVSIRFISHFSQFRQQYSRTCRFFSAMRS